MICWGTQQHIGAITICQHDDHIDLWKWHLKKRAPSPKGRPQCGPGPMVHTPNAPSVWVHRCLPVSEYKSIHKHKHYWQQRPLVDYPEWSVFKLSGWMGTRTKHVVCIDSVVPYEGGLTGVLGIFAPSSGPSKMRHGWGRRMPEGMDSSLPKYKK